MLYVFGLIVSITGDVFFFQLAIKPNDIFFIDGKKLGERIAQVGEMLEANLGGCGCLGEIKVTQNSFWWLRKWQVGNMASWQNGKLAKWQVDKKAS